MLSIFLSLFSYATVVVFAVKNSFGFRSSLRGSHKYRDVFETAKLDRALSKSPFNDSSPPPVVAGKEPHTGHYLPANRYVSLLPRSRHSPSPLSYRNS